VEREAVVDQDGAGRRNRRVSGKEALKSQRDKILPDWNTEHFSSTRERNTP